jgi:Zinc carboxypeptidase
VRALLLVAALAGIHAPPPEPIGQSVEGRPIGVTRVGDPAAPRKVLVVGSLHGNEPAGRSIVAVLRFAMTPPGTELLLVRNLNPDGFAHKTRDNAHGVDLNRNSPQRWEGAGPRPWSEPETRAIRALILSERPSLRSGTTSRSGWSTRPRPATLRRRCATPVSPACRSKSSLCAPGASRAGRTRACTPARPSSSSCPAARCRPPTATATPPPSSPS